MLPSTARRNMPMLTRTRTRTRKLTRKRKRKRTRNATRCRIVCVRTVVRRHSPARKRNATCRRTAAIARITAHPRAAERSRVVEYGDHGEQRPVVSPCFVPDVLTGERAAVV